MDSLEVDASSYGCGFFVMKFSITFRTFALPAPVPRYWFTISVRPTKAWLHVAEDITGSTFQKRASEGITRVDVGGIEGVGSGIGTGKGIACINVDAFVDLGVCFGIDVTCVEIALVLLWTVVGYCEECSGKESQDNCFGEVHSR